MIGVFHFADLLEDLRSLASYVPGIAPLAQETFLFRPFLLLMVLGIAAGAVGTLVNLRRLEFNAEAMVHSVFPGIVAGFALGGSDLIAPGAAAVGVLVVIALVLVGRTGSHHEGGTAVVLTAFFGLGITLSLKKGDMSGQLEALMFGRLLEVTNARLVQSLLVCTLALVFIALTWKENVLVAYDRQGAQAMGVKLLVADIAINTAIAAIVVSASAAVGVLLVIAYLVVPGAAGRLVGRTVARMTLVSILVATLGGWLGMRIMLLPAPHPVSPQAAIVLSIIGIFALIVGAVKLVDLVRFTQGATREPSALGRPDSLDHAHRVGADPAASLRGISQ